MAILLRSKTAVAGLVTDLNQLQTNIDSEATARATSDGDLAVLATTNKTDLVSAINEVLTTAGSGSAASLQKSANLSDVVDAAVSRTNIDVLSTAEVSQAILDAQLASGTNYDVATVAEKDLLTGLTTTDRIFVLDDGDTKWAIYKAITVDISGVGTSWTKIADQNALEAAISAPQIKAAYESNADTNGFTDAEKLTLSYLAVTGAIDLDVAILQTNLNIDLSVGGTDLEAPSAAAVIAFANSAATAGGAIPKIDSLPVNTGGFITLTNIPKGGIDGIMNFGHVRYVDINNIAYDAPVTPTANPYIWEISTDVANEWDAKVVTIQYLYTAV